MGIRVSGLACVNSSVWPADYRLAKQVSQEENVARGATVWQAPAMGKNKRYSPTADKAIKKAGGTVKAAQVAGVHRSTAFRWTQPIQNGGIGHVPVQHQEALINSGLGITPDDFWQVGEEDGTQEKD